MNVGCAHCGKERREKNLRLRFNACRFLGFKEGSNGTDRYQSHGISSLSVPSNLVHRRCGRLSAANFIKHFPQRKNRLLSRELSRHQSVRQHNIHGGAQVQAKMRRDMQKTVAQSPHYLGHPAILRAENVNRILRMFKGGKRFGILEYLHAHRHNLISEQLKRPRMIAEIHPLIPLHPLFPRQALVLRRIYPVSCPDQGTNVKARARTNRGRNIVGILWVDQDYSRSFHCGCHWFRQSAFVEKAVGKGQRLLRLIVIC